MKKVVLLIFCMFYGSFSYGQGCSDAGICSVGNDFTQAIKETQNQIEAGVVFGKGESDVTSFLTYMTYTRELSKKISLSGKITYSQAKGDFGTRGQFGDAFLIGNYTFEAKNNKQWSALMGFKFPFSSANLKINKYPIPMDYQASLGTFDLISAVNLHYRAWDFNAAVQIPVINNNKNSYFKEYSGTDDFPSTNLFKRKPDVLFRTVYTFKTARKFTFKPNVLFIYHVGEDSYETIFGIREKINGSEGLTVNANLISSYALTSSSDVSLSLATPLAVRDIRPDGLTRAFTAAIMYKQSF